jgi:hypothetical protein
LVWIERLDDTLSAITITTLTGGGLMKEEEARRSSIMVIDVVGQAASPL